MGISGTIHFPCHHTGIILNYKGLSNPFISSDKRKEIFGRLHDSNDPCNFPAWSMEGDQPHNRSREQDEPSNSPNISRQDRYKNIFRYLENMIEEFGFVLQKVSDDYIEV
jgi:hypothetical protein